MLQKAAMARAVPKALAAKADLLAAEKKVGAAFCYYLAFAASILCQATDSCMIALFVACILCTWCLSCTKFEPSA